MGTAQNIGNLNVTVSADASSLISSFNQAMDNVEQSVNKMVGSLGKIDAGFERAGLTVLGGARLFSAMHREIMNVIENIDSIPGVPAYTVETIHNMRYALDEANTSLKQNIATLAGWIGQGAMGIGLLTGRILYGADAAKEGLRDLNKEAEIFAKYSFDPKAAASAQKSLEQAKLAYSLIGAGKADSINKLVDESGNLSRSASGMPTHDGQQSVESIRAQAESQQLMNRAMTERLSLEGELQKVTDRLSTTEGALYGATIPKKDQLNALLAREWDLKNEIFDVEQRDPSPDRTQKLIDLKTKLLVIEEKEIPLLKAQQKIWDDMGAQFSNTIQKMIVDGGSLKDTWHTIVKDMEADIVKNLIGDQLKNFFSGMMKSLLGGMAGGTGGGMMSAIVGLFAGHAGGGNMDGPSIVGENGPELFVPSGSGLVLNNDTTRGLTSGKGGGDTYHIDARGADQSAIARLETTIKQLNGSIESRAINANLTYNRRVTPSYNPSL